MPGAVRELLSKEFLLLLGMVLAGLYAATPWVMAPAAVLLTLFSVVSDADFFWRFKRIGKLAALGRFWLQALAQNLMFVALAYGLGWGLAQMAWR